MIIAYVISVPTLQAAELMVKGTCMPPIVKANPKIVFIEYDICDIEKSKRLQTPVHY